MVPYLIPVEQGALGRQKPFEEPGSEAPVHFSHRAASNLPISSAKVDSRLSQLSSLLLLPCLLRRGTQKMFLLPRAPYPAGIICCGNRTNIPTGCSFSHREGTKNVSNMHTRMEVYWRYYTFLRSTNMGWYLYIGVRSVGYRNRFKFCIYAT